MKGYEPGATDRRANPRSPVVVREARCIAGIEVFFGHAVDVSSGGMFIATSKMRAPGTEYEVQFRLPGYDREFRCRVVVVWTRRYRHDSTVPPGIGLRFLDMPEEDRHAIDEWVRLAGPS